MNIPKDRIKKIKVRGGGCGFSETDGDDVIVQGSGWRVRFGWFFRSTLIVTRTHDRNSVVQVAGSATASRLVILLPHGFQPDRDVSG